MPSTKYSATPQQSTIIFALYETKAEAPIVDLEYDLTAVTATPIKQSHDMGDSDYFSGVSSSDLFIEEATENIKSHIRNMEAEKGGKTSNMDEKDQTTFRVGCICGTNGDNPNGISFARRLADQDWPAQWRAVVIQKPSSSTTPPADNSPSERSPSKKSPGRYPTNGYRISGG
ncbi:hypothetical protein BT63DRAFT_444336 [Microthyrium microscopicum]|uniref:Uncharacterized protein n=1 Tax=Microthyrium microscopicum TaxID=703497 RepID=A0A6A6TWN9_9PEZI|nr:hypothetical protein BT63DRAFT_444336 [Microthyrium microscopicum]